MKMKMGASKGSYFIVIIDLLDCRPLNFPNIEYWDFMASLANGVIFRIFDAWMIAHLLNSSRSQM